jgi:membrane protease YdiL (CAAX protease family)
MFHQSRPGVEDPVWRFLDVVLIAVFAILATALLFNIAVAIAHFLPRFRNIKITDLSQNAAVLVPAETVAYLFVVAFMVLIVGMRNRSQAAPWDSVRFIDRMRKCPPRNEDFLTSIRWNMPSQMGALLALLGGACLARVSGIFETALHKWVPKTLPIDELIHDRNSAYLFALFGVLVAPLIEELFFRGFLYPVLARKLGITFSVLLTAAAFAVIHQEQLAHAWVPLLWLFVVGLILTYVRARTKSVATSVLIHVSYNGTLFVLLYRATEGFRHF